MGVTFPGESQEYRAARNKLLEAETELRGHIENVARLRRDLPDGGELKEDYLFHEIVEGEEREVRFSDLFGEFDTLFAYSFMYGPDMKAACPSCTSFIDGLNGQAQHIGQRISMVIVGKHDARTLQDFADHRGWNNLRLVSSAGTTYNADYHGEIEGRQMTMANIFARSGADAPIRHFWGSELGFEPWMEGAESRHIDLAWPVWNIFDLCPDGRGDFSPALAYD